jgi:hypothetical protein
MVVPKGRKISKPVRNAFLNFLEKLVGFADTSLFAILLLHLVRAENLAKA